jgi:hypothetical protein
MTTPDEAIDTTARSPRFIALSRDLFFGMRTRTVLRNMGHDLTLVKDEQGLLNASMALDPSLVFIDFNQPVDWQILAPLFAVEVPVVAFGSHTDIDGFRAARAAGVDRVTSNGDFSRRLPHLVEQYSRQR